MKFVTTIKQSKRLAEILPPETADFAWGIMDRYKRKDGKKAANYYTFYLKSPIANEQDGDEEIFDAFNFLGDHFEMDINGGRMVSFIMREGDIYAWSLIALLSLIPNPTIMKRIDGKWQCESLVGDTIGDDPVDACFEMILLLNKDYE
jgi:hypothetical protein